MIDLVLVSHTLILFKLPAFNWASRSCNHCSLIWELKDVMKSLAVKSLLAEGPQLQMRVNEGPSLPHKPSTETLRMEAGRLVSSKTETSKIKRKPARRLARVWNTHATSSQRELQQSQQTAAPGEQLLSSQSFLPCLSHAWYIHTGGECPGPINMSHVVMSSGENMSQSTDICNKSEGSSNFKNACLHPNFGKQNVPDNRIRERQ